MALDYVETYVLEMLQWFACCRASDEDKVLTEFKNAMTLAHLQLRKEADEHPQLHGMGTTMTLAYSLNEVLFIAHVGDSRCYLFREKHLHRLTQDHTLVEEMVKSGNLSPADAATHRLRHVIISTVGGADPDIRVDVHRLQLEEGDRVLLCSDGLTNMLSDQEIAEILAVESIPESACRQLVALANEHGGRDNITVIIAHYETEAESMRSHGMLPCVPRQIAVPVMIVPIDGLFHGSSRKSRVDDNLFLRSRVSQVVEVNVLAVAVDPGGHNPKAIKHRAAGFRPFGKVEAAGLSIQCYNNWPVTPSSLGIIVQFPVVALPSGSIVGNSLRAEGAAATLRPQHGIKLESHAAGPFDMDAEYALGSPSLWDSFFRMLSREW